jgi:hypothetical protein
LPPGQLLADVTTDRTGYRHYKSDRATCKTCPLLVSCTSSRSATRLIIRHFWADARKRTDAHRLTPWGKRNYKRRKETVERSFAAAIATRAPRPACRDMPVPPCRRTKHQDDRSCPRSQALPGLKLPTPLLQLPFKTKPRRKSTGFVSGLTEAAMPPFFIWLSIRYSPLASTPTVPPHAPAACRPVRSLR